MMNTLALQLLPFRRPETFPGTINDLFGPFFNDWERVGMPERSASTGYVPQLDLYMEGSTLCLKGDLPGGRAFGGRAYGEREPAHPLRRA